jgi:hypothetical protein
VLCVCVSKNTKIEQETKTESQLGISLNWLREVAKPHGHTGCFNDSDSILRNDYFLSIQMTSKERSIFVRQLGQY